MPVDRAARDRLASTLAAYLRCEADNFALDEAIAAPWTEDATLRAVRSGLWLSYDDVKRHSVHATPEGWETHRRTIAFLRTDLEFGPPAPDTHRRLRRRQWAGLAALAVLAVAIYLAYTRSVAWLLLPGVTVGLPMVVAIHLPCGQNGDDDGTSYFPFRDEQQWRLHEHLLEQEHLPPHDPARHQRPIRGPVANTVLAIPGYAVALLVLLPLAAPLMLLPRREHGPAE